MRITDERYRNEQRLMRLAVRLLQLGGRTPTVRMFTQLPSLRIQRMRNTYAPEAASNARLMGNSPFRVDFFFTSARRRVEASLLAGFLRHFGLLVAAEAKQPELQLVRGERLCHAYEAFMACCPENEISIEHGVLLLQELVAGTEIALDLCTEGGELVLRDRLSTQRLICPWCTNRNRSHIQRAD